MKKSAVLSEDKKYRYSLSRVWDETLPTVAFVGLNPSTADAEQDDPTIRRCIRFAQDWGHGGLHMVNLFAFRTTIPTELKHTKDPIGLGNNLHIQHISQTAAITVLAWGIHGSHLDRDKAVLKLMKRCSCLGITKDGHPKHPLYIQADTKLINFPLP